MTKMLRWLGLIPVSLIGFVAVFMLLGLLRGLLLRICPPVTGSLSGLRIYRGPTPQ
ncbi:hypothetical protein [Stenotrophomonas sp. AB1(2024)]|uniref:hypothetical protein n=1 Tax=Stenotrophomonas sp. AB1(2024) TaxID=3132215 RepID=UPI0030B74F39